MRQVRKGIFETNSSSVHTLTIESKKDYEEKEKQVREGKAFYDYDGNVITLEEAQKEYEKYKKNYPDRNDTFDEWRKDYEELKTYEEYETYLENSDLEHFYKEKVIEGVEIIAYGSYGYDG